MAIILAPYSTFVRYVCKVGKIRQCAYVCVLERKSLLIPCKVLAIIIIFEEMVWHHRVRLQGMYMYVVEKVVYLEGSFLY